MTEQRKKALVVDLNNIWNKYLYVRKGDFSETLSSVLHLFRSIYLAKEFSKVFIVIDGKPCDKYDEYKEYKNNRVHNPNKYIPMKVLATVLAQYFTVVGGKTKEGDEVIAYIATRLNKKYDTYIYSNDKDFLQLMQYDIKILTSLKKGFIDTVLSAEEALAKFKNSKGKPLKDLKYILPYRVFKGDVSDGIPPACKGMLDKAIRDIIYKCWYFRKPLDEDLLMLIIGRIEDPSVKEKVIMNKNNILRNYKLMDLCHIPDDYKQNVQKIWYKLDVAGISEYISKEYLYKWV